VLLFHNRVVDQVRRDHPKWPAERVFAAARRLTTWHYQSDPGSFLQQEPAFTPTLGGVAGEFQTTDFLTFAGVAERR
jgi:hypothetical protein